MVVLKVKDWKLSLDLNSKQFIPIRIDDGRIRFVKRIKDEKLFMTGDMVYSRKLIDDGNHISIFVRIKEFSPDCINVLIECSIYIVGKDKVIDKLKALAINELEEKSGIFADSVLFGFLEK